VHLQQEPSWTEQAYAQQSQPASAETSCRVVVADRTELVWWEYLSLKRKHCPLVLQGSACSPLVLTDVEDNRVEQRWKNIGKKIMRVNILLTTSELPSRTSFASVTLKEYIFESLTPSSLYSSMNDSNWIPYTALPTSEGGFSKLFVDYVTDFSKTQRFYETDFRFPQQFPKHFQRFLENYQNREAIASIILDQNRRFGVSERGLEHARLLSEHNTFAVVTGQQVGILAGPLYTIYKTITAIKLARLLGDLYPQHKFVPIFWLEGEDHDFEEVNKVGLLNADHEPVSAEYLVKGKPVTKNLGAVGEICFDEFLEKFFEDLQRVLPNSEFKKSVLDTLSQAYKPGVSFSQGFVSLLNIFFGEDGLVFVNPNDRRIKRFLSPVFEKEIQEFPKVSQLIIQQSAELEGQYHAQIKTKALNLFYFSKGGRYLIEPRENDFSLRGTRQFITRDELLRTAVEQPELLSPNVALRPICQDTILPTLAYVAGPSEVAYFAQLKPVYAHFGKTMPIIYPRASVTLVESRTEKVLEKYQLDLIEFYGNYQRVNNKVVDMVSEVKIDEMFNDAQSRIHDVLEEMRFGLNYIDATLLGALDNTRTKMDTYLGTLKERTVAAQFRRHEIALKQVHRVANTIFPHGNFQERELNISYFLNKHGLPLIEQLKNDVAVDQFKHQLITI
jgi:bacillithiol biosynthesis cysteine-adding enzyme BshC